MHRSPVLLKDQYVWLLLLALAMDKVHQPEHSPVRGNIVWGLSDIPVHGIKVEIEGKQFHFFDMKKTKLAMTTIIENDIPLSISFPLFFINIALIIIIE